MLPHMFCKQSMFWRLGCVDYLQEKGQDAHSLSLALWRPFAYQQPANKPNLLGILYSVICHLLAFLRFPERGQNSTHKLARAQQKRLTKVST
eukprot:scaffold254612_cov18-Tisochrysis_lutea.AAC.1